MEIHRKLVVNTWLFIIPIKIIRTLHLPRLERKKELQIRISYLLSFSIHIIQPMISSNILYFLSTIHRKFLLLSSWTLVYFTHHLFYNEYFFFFFRPPSSFFRISQRFRLIDGKMIYCCGEHPRADNASPLYERCTHIMLRCRDPK